MGKRTLVSELKSAMVLGNHEVYPEWTYKRHAEAVQENTAFVSGVFRSNGIYLGHTGAHAAQGSHSRKTNASAAVALRQAHPEWTATAIAYQLGISRERVRQLLTRESLRTRAMTRASNPPVCQACGKALYPYAKRRLRGNICATCWKKAVTVPRVCQNPACGKEFLFPLARLLNSKVNANYRPGRFCSHACAGVEIGKLYGWGNPNHPIHDPSSLIYRGRPRKYDLPVVRAQIAALRAEGQTFSKIGRELGIPTGSLNYIVYGKRKRVPAGA